MNNFIMHMPTKLIFGKGEHKKIGDFISPYCRKVLIHYGSERIKNNGVFDEVVKSLIANNIKYVERGGVVPNPRVELVRETIKFVKASDVDAILAIGGGSVVDSAKAIAAGVYYDGDVWEIFENNVNIQKALPVIAVITIPAAGSEMSPSAVLTDEAKALKLGYGHQLLKPVISVINPEFFFTLPKNEIGNGVSDMMSHIFERYFTQTENTDLTDALCEATLRTIMKNGPLLIKDHTNYAAWAEIGFSGTVAHNSLLGMGRVEDWATHGIEHSVSAIYDIAHGAGLAVITLAWMKYVHPENKGRFVQFAKNVMGVSNGDVAQAIDELEAFYRSMGLAVRLSELNIEDSKFDLMADKAMIGRDGGIGQFKKLKKDDIVNILKLSL